MRCCDNANSDVVISIQYRYVSDVEKDQGNVREEENNDHPGKGFSLFLNNLTIKEDFNTFTTTTVPFTTYKRVGLCTTATL